MPVVAKTARMERPATRRVKRGQRCTVCDHPRLSEIDQALVRGESAPGIAAHYRGLSDDALRRHRESHLPERLLKAQEVAEVAQADALLDQVRMLHRRALSILDSAEQAGDLRTALGGIREERGCLELLGHLEGELEPPTVNVLLAPEWARLRGIILEALEPFPDARVAVATAVAHAG